MESAESLQQEIASLKEKLLGKDQLLANKNNTIKQLEEMIQSFQQRRFGASSEKYNPDQLCLFNEAEELSEAEPAEELPNVIVASHTRKKKPRVSIPDELPREEIVYDLAESEKVCPYDGAELTHIGDDSHEQLDIIPAKIKVIKHIRRKYACPCCEQHVVTAKKPKLPIESRLPAQVCWPTLPSTSTVIIYRFIGKVRCLGALVFYWTGRTLLTG